MKTAKLTNGILILMLVAGLSLLLYPSLSDYWNQFTSTRAIMNYNEQVEKMDNARFYEMWTEAVAYNERVAARRNIFAIGDRDRELYPELLDVVGIGTMGSIEIPSIDVSLPIYHTTEQEVLQIGIGHLEWSSLPVGGASSHCVLSGHRGLPSARLFSDLDQLEEGDLFYLHVLDQELTYVVDQILIVEPHEVDELDVQEGKDLCTLVTCTPYGINSHRLLVRGHRTDNAPIVVERRVSADAVQIEPLMVALVLVVPLVLLGILMMFAFDRLNRRNKKHF